jgi:hypothetical protein
VKRFARPVAFATPIVYKPQPRVSVSIQPFSSAQTGRGPSSAWRDTTGAKISGVGRSGPQIQTAPPPVYRSLGAASQRKPVTMQAPSVYRASSSTGQQSPALSSSSTGIPTRPRAGAVTSAPAPPVYRAREHSLQGKLVGPALPPVFRAPVVLFRRRDCIPFPPAARPSRLLHRSIGRLPASSRQEYPRLLGVGF